jgi:hypothetical protein
MSNIDSTFWDRAKCHEAVDLAVQFVVVSSKLRTTGRQRNRANPQVADTKDYWFLDHFVNRVKVPFGEKRRSISGTVIDIDQFKQTKTNRIE